MFVLRSISIIPRIPKCFPRLNISCYRHLSVKQVCQKDLPKLLPCTTHQYQQSSAVQKASRFKPLYTVDNIDPHCELIYQYGQDLYYWSLFFHVLAVPSCLSTAYNFGINVMNSETFVLSQLAPPMKILFSVFITVYINKMMRRFLNRIYYDPMADTYTAIHVDWNFKFQKLEFTPKDCEVIDTSTKYGKGNLKIKDKYFSVSYSNFKYPSHFEKIFGMKMIIPEKEADADTKKE